jgi:hypothetical protein
MLLIKVPAARRRSSKALCGFRAAASLRAARALLITDKSPIVHQYYHQEKDNHSQGIDYRPIGWYEP